MTPERKKQLDQFFDETQGKAMERQERPTSPPLSPGEFCKVALQSGFTQTELDEWYDERIKERNDE